MKHRFLLIDDNITEVYINVDELDGLLISDHFNHKKHTIIRNNFVYDINDIQYIGECPIMKGTINEILYNIIKKDIFCDIIVPGKYILLTLIDRIILVSWSWNKINAIKANLLRLTKYIKCIDVTDEMFVQLYTKR